MSLQVSWLPFSPASSLFFSASCHFEAYCPFVCVGRLCLSDIYERRPQIISALIRSYLLKTPQVGVYIPLLFTAARQHSFDTPVENVSSTATNKTLFLVFFVLDLDLSDEYYAFRSCDLAGKPLQYPAQGARSSPHRIAVQLPSLRCTHPHRPLASHTPRPCVGVPVLILTGPCFMLACLSIIRKSCFYLLVRRQP